MSCLRAKLEPRFAVGRIAATHEGFMNARNAIALGLMIAAAPAPACDFCMGPLQGFGKTVRQADGVADAQVANRQLLFAGEGAARVATTFKIAKVLHGVSHKAGETFRTTVQWRGNSEATRALVLFDRSEDGPVFLDALPDPGGRLADYYGQALAMAGKPAARRAAFHFGRLEDRDSEIAEDSYRQFADIPWEAVRDARAELDPAKLRAWLKSAAVPSGRKGLYALLLGTCGSAEDADALRRLLPEIADSTADTGGALAGLCLLTGKPGEVLRAAVTDRKAPATARAAALSVVRFLWTRTAEGDREPLREVIRIALADADTAAFAVDEMARIREPWMTEALKPLWLDPKRRTPAVKPAVLHYIRLLGEPTREHMYKFVDDNP